MNGITAVATPESNRHLLIRFVQIAVAVSAGPATLLLIPYILPAPDLSRFNRIFYTASLSSLIASLGFEFALSRVKPAGRYVIGALLFNTVVSYCVVSGFRFSVSNWRELLELLALSFTLSASAVFTTSLLFSGRFRAYILLSLSRGLLVFCTAALLLWHIRLDPVWLYVATLLPSALIGITLYRNQRGGTSASIGSLYRLGTATFCIDSATGLVLLLDKYVANRYLSQAEANAYIFGWMLASPLYHLGNVIYKTVYSLDKQSFAKHLSIIVVLLGLLVVAYVTIMLFAIFHLPYLFPGSVDPALVLKVSRPMLIGHGLFVIVYFPLTGVFYRCVDSTIIWWTSLGYVSISLLFIATCNYLLPLWSNTLSYRGLLILLAIFLGLLLLLKVIAIRIPGVAFLTRSRLSAAEVSPADLL